MEKKTAAWQVLAIISMVLTGVFLVTAITTTTLYALSNQNVNRLVKQSEKKTTSISRYRKQVRKYKEKEVKEFLRDYDYDYNESDSDYENY